MKINFNQVFKTLDDDEILNNSLVILIVMKASEISGRKITTAREGIKILEEKGIPLSSILEERGKALTLKDLCCSVLIRTSAEEEKKLEGKEKRKRYKLAKKIHDSNEIELMEEEILLLKERIAETSNSLITGQAWEWLDPDDEIGGKNDGTN